MSAFADVPFLFMKYIYLPRYPLFCRSLTNSISKLPHRAPLHLKHRILLRNRLDCFNFLFFGYLYFNMVVLQLSGMQNKTLQYIYQDAMS